MKTEVIDSTTLKQHAPHAQYQVVDVVFGPAYTDIEVRHRLQPPTPEHIDYIVVRQSQAGTIYHDVSVTRKVWQNGVIYLRSNIAGARATLLLSVGHDKRELDKVNPPSITPALAAHTHDAADVDSGSFDVARIPDLDAAKIISGTFAPARIPSLDTSILTTGTLARARMPSEIAYEDEANTFIHTGNSFSEILGVAKGLAFPATQVPSSNANTLDDYEENDWTPTLGGSTSQSGQVHNTGGTGGRFIKIGKQVMFTGSIQVSTIGTITGAVEIQGLPFTSANHIARGTVTIGYFANLASPRASLSGYVVGNSSVIRLTAVAAGGSTGIAELTQADLAANFALVFSGKYEASS